MYYSDDVVEEVRSRSDIVDVISGYISLKQRGNNFTACCPFHSDNSPSFSVSRDKQLYHCFGCGEGGNVFTFIMKYENFTFPEAIKYLADRAGFTLPERELSESEKRSQNEKQRLRDVNKDAANYFYKLLMRTEHGKRGLEYFKKRGLDEDDIKKFGLGYSDIYSDDTYKYLKSKGYSDKEIVDAGLADIDEVEGGRDKFWNRVMIPIQDINGKVIAFGGRVLGDAKPKYVNTRDTKLFNKSEVVYMLNEARRSKRRGVILCEGYMDVISLHKAGFDNAVAALGTAFTPQHANLIKRFADLVYVSTDSDEAGTVAACRVVRTCFNARLDTKYINLKPYKDPDELILAEGTEGYEKRIKDAIPGLMFLIDVEAATLNLNDPDDKSVLYNKAADLLSRIEDPSKVQTYIESFSNRYFMDGATLKKTITKYRKILENQADDTEKDTVYQLNKRTSATTVQTRTNEENSEGRNTEAERLLLTWLIDMPILFKHIEGILDESYFVDDDVKPIAELVFDQYRRFGHVEPAKIVNHFQEVELQALAGKIVQTTLPFDVDDAEKGRTVTDLVKRTLEDYVKYMQAHANGDMKLIMEMFDVKGKIKNINIRL